MPVFNAQDTIQKAIESIFQQTHDNWELLILDDASTDDTLEKAEKFIYDSRVKIFRQDKSKGLLKSINFLLEQALGSYICFQMPQDYAHTQRLALQMNAFLDNSNLGLLSTAYYNITEQKEALAIASTAMSHKDILATLARKSPILFNTIMFRRSIFEKIGGLRVFFKDYAKADYDWLYLVAEKYECLHIENALYYHRCHNNRKAEINPTVFIGNKIVQYLAIQRREKGKDDLQNNQYQALNAYIQNLMKPYQKDPSLVYRKYAEDFMQHRLHASALWAAWQSICTAPNKIVNYKTYISCLRTSTLQKLIKS